MNSRTRTDRELRRLRYELKVAGQQVPYLRALVEGTSDLLALVSSDGEILEHNSAFALALGDRQVLLHGLDVRRLFYAKTPTVEDPGGRQALFTGADLQDVPDVSIRKYGFFGDGAAVECTLGGVDIGGQRLVVVSAILLDDAAQRARDLHDAEVRVQRLQRELVDHRQQERAVRYDSLAVLAGTLAHDLNNAMAVLFGNLDLLGECLEDPRLVQLVEDIHESTRSTRELSIRLGTFSRGSGVVLAPLRVQPWLESVTRALAQSHRTVIPVEMPEAPCWIQGDEAQLTQVILNLVTNAFQASWESPEISLRVDLDSPAGDPGTEEVLIEVLDRGSGIKDDLLEKLFEPFFSTKPGGSGLGLASAFRIIDAHSGCLCAANRDGGGARFTIRLPMCEAPSRTAIGSAAGTPHRPSSVGVHRLETHCVLLLDDDPFVRQTLARILRREGATVLEADRGEKTVRAFQGLLASGLPEGASRLVAVLDLNIASGMDGITTLRQLQMHDPAIRAIACTGHTNRDIATDFRILGFEGYLAKPFRAKALVDTVLGVVPGPTGM